MYHVLEIRIARHPPKQIRKTTGEDVIFTVEANGPGELHYQWTKNKIFITDDKYSNCKGANESSFHITNLQKEFEGKYRCVITSEYDRAESTSAELTGIATSRNYCIIHVNSYISMITTKLNEVFLCRTLCILNCPVIQLLKVAKPRHTKSI